MTCPRCGSTETKWIEVGKFCKNCKQVWMTNIDGTHVHPLTGNKIKSKGDKSNG